MPPAHVIRAVLFDLGDTLVEYGEVDRRALFEEATRRTYRFWARRQRRMPDYRRYYLHQAFALRWGYLKLLLRRREMNAMRLIRRSCRKLWLTAEDEFFEKLAWQWYRPLADVSRPDPDAAAVLGQLQRRGVALGIVSNTFVPGQVLDRHLRKLGLLPYFPVRVYSCDVGYRKPDPRVFDVALRQVNVRPEEAVFVGDLCDADIEGARRAGMTAVWKRPRGAAGHAGPPPGVAMIERLGELPGVLASLGLALPAVLQLSHPGVDAAAAASCALSL